MRTCGIITEYNPFHNGHRYHIERSRELTQCDCLIAVMSGNFVQRGEPAIIDKWQRAATAITQGVDLLLELPYIYATQSADSFAYGAIRTLELAGADCFVFGSESNDLSKLQQLAAMSEQMPIDPKQAYVKSFAQYTETLSSNDLLGISYLKAIQGSKLTPYTIQRTNSYHELDHDKEIASASAIRHALQIGKNVRHATIMADKLDTTHTLDAYYPYLQTLLLTSEPESIAQIFLMEEGLEQRMYKQAAKHTCMQDFVNACISKRYTRSRIQRTLVHVLTQTTKQQAASLGELSHIRVLAFNDIGRNYLSSLQDTHVVSRFNQLPLSWRTLELKATQAYTYPLPPTKRLALTAQEWQPPQYLK